MTKGKITKGNKLARMAVQALDNQIRKAEKKKKTKK